MPKTSDLVGVSEVAERLGWPTGKVSTYAARGLFPEPVAELASGRIWRWQDVERVAREKGWLPRS